MLYGLSGRTGPPIAPSRTASAFLPALRASSVKGDPMASIDASIGCELAF